MRLLFDCPKQASWRRRRRWWPGRRGDRRRLPERRRLPVSLATRHARRGKTGRKTTRQRRTRARLLRYGGRVFTDENRTGVRVRGLEGSRRACGVTRRLYGENASSRQLHEIHTHTLAYTRAHARTHCTAPHANVSRLHTRGTETTGSRAIRIVCASSPCCSVRAKLWANPTLTARGA